MLVLSRKHGEAVIIGRNVVVTVLSIGRNRVRLGIRGPADVPVHRSELARRRASPGGGREPVATAAR